MRPLLPADVQKVLTGRVLIACDFDGTLSPIVPHPSLACLPERTEATLRELAAIEGVTLAILSGRALADLRERVHVPCILAGNHGLEISGAGIEYLHPVAAERAPVLNEAQTLLEPLLRRYPGAWFENKHLTATVDFRQVAAPQRHQLMWDIRQALHAFGPNIGMRAGKCSLEIHLRVGWDKGCALRMIRDAAGLEDSPCLVFGDDATDESMFCAVPSEVTVHVGPAVVSSARFSLPTPAAVSHTLQYSVQLLINCQTPLVQTAV